VFTFNIQVEGNEGKMCILNRLLQKRMREKRGGKEKDIVELVITVLQKSAQRIILQMLLENGKEQYIFLYLPQI
jgi:hypothetical protein